MKQADLFGTEPRKLARRKDPDTSHVAAAKVKSAKLEAMVYQAILSFGAKGCISDEVRARKEFDGMPYSSVTARYAALIEKKLIFDSGQRRKGNGRTPMRVMVADQYKAAWQGDDG